MNEASSIRASPGRTLRNPGELGHKPAATAAPVEPQQEAADFPQQQEQLPSTLLHAAKVRQEALEQLYQSQYRDSMSTATSTSNSSSTVSHEGQSTTTTSPSSRVASFHYRGMEVSLVLTATTLYWMDARTHLIFQQHNNNDDDDDHEERTTSPRRLSSNPVTGQVCVELLSSCISSKNDSSMKQHSTIIVYEPYPVDPKLESFGLFRWKQVTLLKDMDQHSVACLDNHGRLLVVSHHELQVWKHSSLIYQAPLQTPSTTTFTRMHVSGDGRVIGLLNSKQQLSFYHQDTSTTDTDTTTDSSLHYRYRQDVTIDHVVYFAFRGLGHLTSSFQNHHDLLLIHQSSEMATIYNQNLEKQTEWRTPPFTHIGWVRGISSFLLGDLEVLYKQLGQTGTTNPSIPSHMSTFSNAGAWISEITFQGAFPALRLSRLTYLKRGTDEVPHPVLLESVSSFLPAQSLWDGASRDDLIVEGIWPAWNPLQTEPTKDNHTNETLRGSAMSFLGISNATVPSSNFGESFLGDTQRPPSELRITASHPLDGCAIVMEFPFVYDGLSHNSLELGKPIRSVLSLNDASVATLYSHQLNVSASRDFEGGRLVAKIMNHTTEEDSIQLLYRRPGTMSMLPCNFLPDDAEDATIVLRDCRRLQDESLIPAPLLYPAIRLPSKSSKIKELLWYPDEGLGYPPTLFCIYESGSIVVLSIPTPRDVFELPVPGFEDFTHLASPTVPKSDLSELYEVYITPHPEFGLGLRLESRSRGRGSVTGSFKRHPTSGETLPAEATGLIEIGDELVGANGLELEDKDFDEVIQAVRTVGMNSGPRNPVKMVFRRKSQQQNPSSVYTTPLSAHDQRRKIFDFEGGNDPSTEDPGYSTTGATQFKTPFILASFENPIDTTTVAPWGRCVSFVSCERGNSLATLAFLSGDKLKFCEIDLRNETPQIWQKGETIPSPSSSLITLDAVSLNGEDPTVVVIDDKYRIYIVHIDRRSSTDFRFRSHLAFTVPNDNQDGIILKAYSPELIATMIFNESRDCIKVWTPRLHPGCPLNPSQALNAGDDSNYHSQDIRIEASSRSLSAVRNRFLHFDFVQTGFLDNFPCLLVFSCENVVRYQKEGGKSGWTPNLFLSYKITSVGDDLSTTFPGESLLDILPHMLSAIQLVHNYSDEAGAILSDWSPQALLAGICTDTRGAKHAMEERVRPIFDWLLSEASCITEDHLDGPLVISPMAKTKLPSSKLSDSKQTSLFNGSDSLLSFVDTISRKAGITDTAFPTMRSKRIDDTVELPPVLQVMKEEDLIILWTLGDMLLNPPNLDSLDLCGELACYSYETSSRLSKLQPPQKPGPERKEASVKSLGPSLKNMKWNGSEIAPLGSCNSASCLASLLSKDQSILLDRCRANSLNWDFVRRCKIPFWLRSDKALAKLSEDVGQSLFRESRDIMECSIFFIIAGKMRTLRNLAATDKSESGRKFFKFITEHDFASERGRRAAEKNAFSLLRKNKYRVASAFFLLADPPSLKPAIETVITKLKDLNLAFMISRLVESPEIRAASGTTSGFPTSLSGYGGGGGYAGGGTQGLPAVEQHDEPFDAWNPSILSSTRSLLVDRIIPSLKEDHLLCSVAMLWLGKKEEAIWWSMGLLEKSFENEAGYRVLSDSLLRGKRRDVSSAASSIEAATIVFNRTFDLFAPPIILKALKAGDRAMSAVTYITGSQMLSHGIDLYSIRTLQVATGDPDSHGTVAIETEIDATSSPEDNVKQDASSIFDQFTVPVTKNIDSAMDSSIFNDFDVPKAGKINRSDPSQDLGFSSSIFDSFSSPPTSRHNIEHKNVGTGMQSSIFDSFDVPAPPRKLATPQILDESSIFDAYDVPRTKAKIGFGDNNNQNSQKVIDDNTTKEDDSKAELVTLSLSIEQKSSPEIWEEWKNDLILESAARRLLREIATVLSGLRSDIPEREIHCFYSEDAPLLPTGASEVLQLPCDADSIFSGVKAALVDLSSECNTSTAAIANCAMGLIQTSSQQHRTVFLIFLYIVIDRVDLAEEVLSITASRLIGLCTSFSFSNDELLCQCKSRSFVSSQFARRISARLSWQLEVSLWFHRGGCLPLVGRTLKLTTVAIRVGLLVASWSRHFYCIESMIRSPPDCHIDEENGKRIWASLKAMSRGSDPARQTKPSSGGWEFLVDCRRSEASNILKNQPTGSFIIRPHQRDNGVFTLSFKTNLAPKPPSNDESEDIMSPEVSGDELTEGERMKILDRRGDNKKDDSVQHAVIRLSESGFRCGSFGPFASLIELLESVSESLPFPLRFDLPPENRAIKEEGLQTSPNAVFFRRLALTHADSLASNPPGSLDNNLDNLFKSQVQGLTDLSGLDASELDRLRAYGIFLELCVLSKLRVQFSGISVYEYNTDSYNDEEDTAAADVYAWASSRINPFLQWCKTVEIRANQLLAPEISFFPTDSPVTSVSSFGDKSISDELESRILSRGDTVLKEMIRKDSGLHFTTLRLVNGGECTLVVLFRKEDAIEWLIASAYDTTPTESEIRLKVLEKKRIIESIDLSSLPLKQKNGSESGIRYRFIDPWEVESVEGHDGESRGSSLGRERYVGFSLGKVALSSEGYFRALGNLPLLELWTCVRGNISITKALATVKSPWERGAGGDLRILEDGLISEPAPMSNSIQEQLYRNTLFRRMHLPQRYVSIVQVELLDLKNLTSPGGSLALSVYAILRLKRRGSNARLTNKSRTLDTASTVPIKLGKSSGPNAPASWGSVVRFRFALPEDVNVEGKSIDEDREVLFRGHPSVLQLSVYERKLLVDSSLGTADVPADGLWAGGQLEEWVPLRSEKESITWFARVRLTLRFEMMCRVTDTHSSDLSSIAPSSGRRRIEELSRSGGATSEDAQKRSMSSPDLVGYFESMVY